MFKEISGEYSSDRIVVGFMVRCNSENGQILNGRKTKNYSEVTLCIKTKNSYAKTAEILSFSQPANRNFMLKKVFRTSPRDVKNAELLKKQL